ncbi:MAG: hypothetical protein QME42_05895 [bacterium]|nr:hypothetical protein [bacterium]
MEQKNLYNRFIKYKWPQQLGNLASTLARLSSLSTKVDYDEISKNLLREATLLIEWCTTNIPQRLHSDLAFIQRELCYWRKVPLKSEIRNLLSLRCRIMSDHLLDISGLLNNK